MKNRIWFVLLAVCVFAVGGYAQDTTGASGEKTAAEIVKAEVTRPDAGGDKVTVYIYRYKQFTGSALEPAVYVDEKKVAAMDNGRYFKVVVPAGKHSFTSNDKQSGVEIELKNGEEYYIRVDLVTGFWKGHGRLTMIQKEQGTFEIKKLKPMGKEKIFDHSVAFTEEEEVKKG